MTNLPKHLSEKIEKEAEEHFKKHISGIDLAHYTQQEIRIAAYTAKQSYISAAQAILSDPGAWALAGSWVKCSDRLPDEEWCGPTRHNYDGKYDNWEYDAMAAHEVKKYSEHAKIEWLDPSAPGERGLVDKEGVKALYEAYRKYDGPLLFTDWLDSNPIETLKNHKQ